MSTLSVAALCVTAAVLILFVKQYRPEFAMLLSAAVGAAVLLVLLNNILPLVEGIRQRLSDAGLASGFAVLFKVIGICYLTEFSADMCRDFGQSSLAGKVELAGKIAVAAAALPLVNRLFDLTDKLIQ